MRLALLLAAIACGAPIAAQDHDAGHAMPAQESHAGDEVDADAADPSPGPLMETPPPPEAGSGPPRAADAIWGAQAMAASRKALEDTHGDFAVLWVQGDRFELQSGEGEDQYLFDFQGYYGGPANRLWFKAEGGGGAGRMPNEAELQALYAHAVAPFWDVQAGMRHDLAGLDTTHAVIGVQGLAPYMFEVDAALFLSTRGDLTARIEAEVDQRITQRLILQPRVEADLSAQDIPRLGVGAGLDKIALGARLRYEIAREFAPYVGVEQSWRTGAGANFARDRGEPSAALKLLAGIRWWF